jgi:uncharacterized protein DUF2568
MRLEQPVNLAVRFLLELSALLALGLWGWHWRDDGFRIVAALTIPIVAASLWGTFAVPNDPSRSGSAPVPVSGLLRLALEFCFFGGATLALYNLGFAKLTATFGAAVVIHYLVSYDRLRWLVRQ